VVAGGSSRGSTTLTPNRPKKVLLRIVIGPQPGRTRLQQRGYVGQENRTRAGTSRQLRMRIFYGAGGPPPLQPKPPDPGAAISFGAWEIEGHHV